jgi:hypothetical protein
VQAQQLLKYTHNKTPCFESPHIYHAASVFRDKLAVPKTYIPMKLNPFVNQMERKFTISSHVFLLKQDKDFTELKGFY